MAYKLVWKQGYDRPNFQTLVFNKEQIKSYDLIIFLFVELQVESFYMPFLHRPVPYHLLR